MGSLKRNGRAKRIYRDCIQKRAEGAAGAVVACHRPVHQVEESPHQEQDTAEGERPPREAHGAAERDQYTEHREQIGIEGATEEEGEDPLYIVNLHTNFNKCDYGLEAGNEYNLTVYFNDILAARTKLRIR